LISGEHYNPDVDLPPVAGAGAILARFIIVEPTP